MEKAFVPGLSKAGKRKPVYHSESKIELADCYDPEELKKTGFDPDRDLGFPGTFPYTRGIYPAMYRADFWIMGQYAGFGNPEATNERFKYLFSKGQTALALALDLPTQLGIESDDEMADGEVRKAGVAINSLRDMEEIFDGIPLSKPRQIFTTANGIGPIMLALFVAVALRPDDGGAINIHLKGGKMKTRASVKGLFLSLFFCALILAVNGESLAQNDFPSKAIEVIVPYTPGGGVDLGVRFFSDKWTEFLGQPVVIVNKPGAGGYLGGKAVALAKPDGYTLLGTSESNLMLTPLLRKEPDYTIDSFRILFFFSKTYLYFNVRSDSPWKTINDLLADAKKNPGKLRYSTYGVGSAPHFAVEMLLKKAGAKMTLVPFKSSPESMTALIGRNVDMCVVFGVPGVSGTGLVRQLAVGDYERAPDFPNVPTLKEQGYDLGYNTSIYLGLSAPAKIPEKAFAKLIDAHDKVRQKYAKEISEKLPKLDQHPTYIDGPTGMKIHKDKEKIFKELIPQIGIKIE